LTAFAPPFCPLACLRLRLFQQTLTESHSPSGSLCQLHRLRFSCLSKKTERPLHGSSTNPANPVAWRLVPTWAFCDFLFFFLVFCFKAGLLGRLENGLLSAQFFHVIFFDSTLITPLAFFLIREPQKTPMLPTTWFSGEPLPFWEVRQNIGLHTRLRMRMITPGPFSLSPLQVITRPFPPSG